MAGHTSSPPPPALLLLPARSRFLGFTARLPFQDGIRSPATSFHGGEDSETGRLVRSLCESQHSGTLRYFFRRVLSCVCVCARLAVSRTHSFESLVVQVVPGLILYSQVFRPGKAKIMLQGAQLLTDPTDDRIFIVKEPSHTDPDKKNKINPAKDHRFQASNRVSRDQWLRALNQAMAPTAASGTVAQGGPLGSVGAGAVQANLPQPFPTAPGFQQLMLIVPPGVRPGQSFMFRAMGQTFSTTCPQGKNPGDRIDVRIPIPQQQHQTQQQAAAAAAAAAAANATSGPRYPPPASQTHWQQPQASQPARMRVQARPDTTTSDAAPQRVRVRARADGPESTATPSAPAFDALNPDVVSSQQEVSCTVEQFVVAIVCQVCMHQCRYCMISSCA